MRPQPYASEALVSQFPCWSVYERVRSCPAKVVRTQPAVMVGDSAHIRLPQSGREQTRSLELRLVDFDICILPD
jgi:hypothetical protein